MKKNLILVSLLAMASISCSPDSDNIIDSEYNEAIEQGVSKKSKSLQSKNNTTVSLANESEYTAYGADTFERVKKGEKRVFNKEQLKELGLPTGYYIVDYYKVRKKLYCPKGSEIHPIVYRDTCNMVKMGTKNDNIFGSAPMHGFLANPDYDGEENGYFYGETYTAIIVSNTSGITYNKYYPCPLEELKWIYTCK